MNQAIARNCDRFSAKEMLLASWVSDCRCAASLLLAGHQALDVGSPTHSKKVQKNLDKAMAELLKN
jgi:hypothetical protein